MTVPEPAVTPHRSWRAGRFTLDLSAPRVMGIVNLTPDSFYDGGRNARPHAAIAAAERLLREGAHLLDVGAESTRPGAQPLTTAQEWERLAPVLPALVRLACPLSVDTSDPDIMRRALDLGADIVNDVRALRRPGALDIVARHPTAGLCLMHMLGEPVDMQHAPHYHDVVDDVQGYLRERLAWVTAAGIDAERVVIDPGYGFGKTLADNLRLARHQRALLQLGRPLLVGWSRKGTLGHLTGRAVQERLVPSVAAALAAAAQGASILRVHDVQATVDALKVWDALTPPPVSAVENAQRSTRQD